jgi:hypothetical protein
MDNSKKNPTSADVYSNVETPFDRYLKGTQIFLMLFVAACAILIYTQKEPRSLSSDDTIINLFVNESNLVGHKLDENDTSTDKPLIPSTINIYVTINKGGTWETTRKEIPLIDSKIHVKDSRLVETEPLIDNPPPEKIEDVNGVPKSDQTDTTNR